MDQTVVLIPVLCLKCSAPIPAEPDQVAWVCPVCHQALLLDDQTGLQPLELYYAATLQPGGAGKPYWVADGQVVLQRETFGSNKNSDAAQFWSLPRRFFIPAYRAPLEELLTRATDLLYKPPPLQAGAPGRFEPITLDVSDIHTAAEFIVLAVEAARPDRLKKITFELKLSKPVLWVLPS